MEHPQSLTIYEDPYARQVMPAASAQMLPPTGLPQKRKRKQEILDEEEYVDALSRIIERDYFPQLAAAKSHAHSAETAGQDISGLTVDSFFDKFTSYDNDSFEDLQQKSVEEFRRKHAWLYELPPDEVSGKHRISGMMMLYYLGNEVISAEQREKMDAILNGPEDVGDNRPNGSQPARFRVRNQLMFPPELAVSEDICRMHEDVANATHAATAGAQAPSQGNFKSILPGQQVSHNLMIENSEAGPGGGKKLLLNDGTTAKSLNNQANNLTALQQALVRYNRRLASGNQSDPRNEKVIQRSNTSLPAAAIASHTEGTPTLTSAQLLAWEHSQQAKNSGYQVATRRFPGLVLEEPHTPSLRSSTAESGSASSGSVVGDSTSDFADTYPAVYPGGHMRRAREYLTVPMSPCPVPGEGALQSMTPLFTWGSVEGTPVLLERFADAPSSSGGYAGARGGGSKGAAGASMSSASGLDKHDKYMKELQERALMEEEKELPRFTLKPTTQRELLARTMDSKNQAKSNGQSSGGRSAARTPHSERTTRTTHTPKLRSEVGDDDVSVVQRRQYYASAHQSQDTASVAGSTVSVSTHRRSHVGGTSSLSAKERLARLTPAARALAEKLNKRVSTPLI